MQGYLCGDGTVALACICWFVAWHRPQSAIVAGEERPGQQSIAARAIPAVCMPLHVCVHNNVGRRWSEAQTLPKLSTASMFHTSDECAVHVHREDVEPEDAGLK